MARVGRRSAIKARWPTSSPGADSSGPGCSSPGRSTRPCARSKTTTTKTTRSTRPPPGAISRPRTVKDVLNGWAYVAVGASLLATKETWELHESYEWPEWVFWGLVVVMIVFCVATTRLRAQHRQARPAAED